MMYGIIESARCKQNMQWTTFLAWKISRQHYMYTKHITAYTNIMLSKFAFN